MYVYDINCTHKFRPVIKIILIKGILYNYKLELRIVCLLTVDRYMYIDLYISGIYK